MIAQADPVAYYREQITEYIEGVRSGSVVVGRLVKLAIERHCRDIETGHERGLYFNEDVALRSVLFFPMCLRHSIGEFAGEAFELAPWQAFVVYSLFGWQWSQTKLRRFRKAYISVARKNGKTTLAAGIALKSLYFDEPVEAGAQVYCVGTKEDQAKLLYAEAARMVEQCPWLLRKSVVRKSPCQIIYAHSYFRPLGSDSEGTDGLNPHCVVADELHAWREHHRPLKEKLSTGGGARRQPLELIITTAGDAESELWKEEDEYAKQAVEAVERDQVFDDTYFAYAARLDDADDPFDSANWIKANPNLGISAKLEHLHNQAREAKNKPTVTNQFIRYHCNQMTEASERLISPEAWQAGARELSVVPGDYAHGGIDVGRSDDWCGVSLVFPRGIGTNNAASYWEIISQCWTCTDGRFKVDAEPFRSWIRTGRLIACRGNCVDINEVEQWIVEQAGKYDVRSWAFDRTFARDLAMRLKDVHGLNVFEFSQSHRFYNEPVRRLQSECVNGAIIHANDPVLSWQASNLQVHRNHKDEWMPDKSAKGRKIDGIVAALMAFSECLFAEKKPTGSLFVSG